MWNKEIYEALDDEDYIFGKLTNNGGYNNIFFKEQKQPYRKKRHKLIEERVDVLVASLLEAKNAPISSAGKPLSKELTKERLTQEKGNKMVKMTLRELFDFYYNAYEKEKWKARWSKIMNHFRAYIPEDKRRRKFVKENFKRKRHNEKARKLRMNRKMSVNGFNYFVTFTYSDEKMTETGFIKKLKAYFRNNVNRYGWKYIGVWEGWDGSVRLHFHALMYISSESLPGGKRKKFNVYAKTREKCEKKLAKMIAEKKAEIAKLKQAQKKG